MHLGNYVRTLALCLVTLMLCCTVAFASAGESPEVVCQTAMEMYSWFALSPLDVDMDVPDASLCRFRVFDENYNTRVKMETALREVFSEEITQMLLGSGVYAEEEGYLYAAQSLPRSIDPNIDSVEYMLMDETDETRTYVAAVFYADPDSGEIDSIEEYTLFQEKQGENWVFTEFWFFW